MRTSSLALRPDEGYRHGRVAVAAFTLIELLVTLAIVLVVFATLTEFLANAERVWKTTTNDPFAEAQDAFETIVERLSGATLAPYQDYADASGAFRSAANADTFVPDHLALRSDLAFVSGPSSAWLGSSGRSTASDCIFFLAPHGYTQTEAHLGLDRLLNALGFFVEFSDESSVPAFILSGAHRWRWRLKEIVQPSESLTVYQHPDSLTWIQNAGQAQAPTSILAENVIALIVLPERALNDPAADTPLSPDYQYDSRDTGNQVTYNQLPTRLRVVLVAVDELSAQTLAAIHGAQPPSLWPKGLFLSSAKMDADLSSLDTSLASAKIRHRIFQREILLPSAVWVNPSAP